MNLAIWCHWCLSIIYTLTKTTYCNTPPLWPFRLYDWTLIYSLCVFRMDDQGKCTYLTYTVKWRLSKNVILYGRFTHAYTLKHVHLHRHACTGTDLEQQGDMTQSGTVYCAWNEQNGHMLLPCNGCRMYEFFSVLQTRDFIAFFQMFLCG